MQIFRVGGQVRDTILNQMGHKNEIKDEDFVVVGSSHDEMISLGFQCIGAAFPVYIHPSRVGEYALARTEKATGSKHTDFTCNVNGVTLEQDLSRRDLTINAIAMDASGNIIDPFGGVNDLETGTIRHVSTAFQEDPLRIYRTARFAARYGFEIAEETIELILKMVARGDHNHLSQERIWIELTKAVNENKNPSLFFQWLASFGVLPDYISHADIFLEMVFNMKNPTVILASIVKAEGDKPWIPTKIKDIRNRADNIINLDLGLYDQIKMAGGWTVDHLFEDVCDVLIVHHRVGIVNRMKMTLRTCRVHHRQIMKEGFKGAQISAELERRRREYCMNCCEH